MFSAWRDRARLEGILLSLVATMSLAGRLHREFREQLSERNGIAEIRTEDRKSAWSFRICNGRLRAARGGHPDPDYAMVYRNAPSAVELLTQGTDEAFMQGLADGKVRFDGDLAFGMWFNDLLKKLGSVVQETMQALPLRRPR